MTADNHRPFIIIILTIFSGSFFFGIAVNSIAFVLLLAGGVSLILVSLPEYKTAINGKKILWTSIVFFLYILVREGFEGIDLDKSEVISFLPLLLMPLLIGGFKISKRIVDKIINAFVVAAIFTAIINLGYAFYRGFIITDKINFWYFSYDLLTDPFSIQPIYLGMFYVFGLMCLIPMLRANKLYAIGFILLAVSLVLLSVRNALLCALILIPIFCVFKYGLSFKLMLSFVISLIIGGVIAVGNPIVKNRILKATSKGNFFSGTDLRYQIWQSSMEASKPSILFGHGKYEGKGELAVVFEKKGLTTPLEQNYNSHNQFLDFVLCYGIIGLVLFIGVIVQMLLLFVRNKDALALFWLLSIIIACITESILFRQWGMMYFTFFGCLFYAFNQEKFDNSR